MSVFRSRLGVTILSLGAIAGGYYGGRPLLERVEFARAEADVNSAREQLSTIEDLSTVFRHVGKVVEPSVVNIKVHKTLKEPRINLPDNNDLLRKFFRDHGGQLPEDNNNGNNDNDDEMEQIGTGSGVILDVNGDYGFILTNNHVAGDATSMEVTLSDGRTLKGNDVKLLGADAKSDLAVIQIKAGRLIPAKWGNSDELEKGNWVLAFGSPFGYVGSMTHGIVSALNRNPDLGGIQGYEDFIQVDAPINPGNSGGPLVNIHGEVVGINTAIATVSGGFQGIGFAIPSNHAQEIYSELKEHHKVVRGWLGVGIASVSEPDALGSAKALGYTGTTGVLVQEVFSDSPSFGKLQAGDVITGINGTPVNDSDQLRNKVACIAPNTKITLQISRDGKPQDVEIILAVQPEDLTAFAARHGAPSNPGQSGSEDQNAAPSAFGITFQTLDQESADKLGISNLKTGGALIASVERHSPAAEAGLRPGIVITAVGKTPVHTAKEAVNALQKADIKQGIALYEVTRQGSRFVFLQSDQDSK